MNVVLQALQIECLMKVAKVNGTGIDHSRCHERSCAPVLFHTDATLEVL